MSDELRLPDHLAACEALLAAQPLPASGINRDQLMYRAGWAAGTETARLAAVIPPRVNGGLRSGAIAAWSLTSAAIAASLAVVATLQWRPVDMGELAADPAGLRPPLAAHVVESRASELPRVALAQATTESQNIGRLDTGLIALRQRALASAWDEPTSVALTDGDSGAPAMKTARELMQELLPADGTRRRAAWPWTNNAIGDSI